MSYLHTITKLQWIHNININVDLKLKNEEKKIQEGAWRRGRGRKRKENKNEDVGGERVEAENIGEKFIWPWNWQICFRGDIKYILY